MTVKELTNEAYVIQKRVKRRNAKGIVVTADMVWAWIRERHPRWSTEDQERIFERVRF